MFVTLKTLSSSGFIPIYLIVSEKGGETKKGIRGCDAGWRCARHSRYTPLLRCACRYAVPIARKPGGKWINNGPQNGHKVDQKWAEKWARIGSTMDHEWVLRPSYSKQAGEKVPGCDVAMKSKRRELRSSLAQPSYSQTRSKIISVAKRSQSGFCEYHWLKIDFQQFLQKQCSQNVAKRFCKYYWLKSRFSRFGYVSYVFLGIYYIYF